MFIIMHNLNWVMFLKHIFTNFIYWYTGEISSKMELQEQLKYSNQCIEKSLSILILFNGIQYKSLEYKCVSLSRLFWNEQFFTFKQNRFSVISILQIFFFIWIFMYQLPTTLFLTRYTMIACAVIDSPNGEVFPWGL